MKDVIPTIQSVMFDLDGTLIDSVPVYFQLMQSILKTVGLPPAPDPLIAEFMTKGISALEKMIPDEKQDQREELIEQCLTVGRRMSWEMFRDEVELIPGVGRLFASITRRRIQIAVVSNTQRCNMDRKLIPLDRRGIKDDLAATIAIEDAPKRKPAPDPLLACAHKLAVSPHQCIYVGDSHVDIQAGRAAGMLTVGVLTGLDDRQTLQRENPTMIKESVADLIPFFMN